MQLDRVRRHASLAVVVVEEVGPDDAGSSADPGDPRAACICLRRRAVAPEESVFEQLRVRVRIGRRAATEEYQLLLVV